MAADSRSGKAEQDLILNSQVAQALAVIGDRWAMLVIRDVFLGFRRFEDLRHRSGAARGTLASRLKRLVENGILYRNPYQMSPPRYEYRLTDKGLDLYPVILSVWNWDTRWGFGGESHPELVHKHCGHAMQAEFRCSACAEPITMYSVRFEPGAPDSKGAAVPARFQRRSKKDSKSSQAADQRFFHTLDVIGDRWTGLVTAAAYFGLRRYDDIAKGIGIATNILSDRLKLLVHHGIMERKAYQKRPVRYEYRLTEKGMDLYLVALTMHEWANRWIVAPDRRPLELIHRPCGEPLVSAMVCSECGEALKPEDVDFDRDAYRPRRGTARANR
ncbi:winged helix-turn-helix transcriptional regulator [Lentisalinibacter sediminis]|uniref:winged helix-turn-helix transcriptional regulator n=1 Tax=Lentisalinibacter sediminis TaxID=2992237 RepID=UPI0038684B8C